ncbi:hypothetical protein PHYC_02215 [Phycisphaerales bacterium]|nr:hypothetical protein PHYC_02215 [Phycisphaerales bacterium]
MGVASAMLAESAQSALPEWLAPILLLGGLVAGAVLLVSGGRLLRPGLVLAGVLAGVGGGLTIVPQWQGFSFFQLPAEWLIPSVGAIVGGAAALALFRVAMAVGAALTFGGVGGLAGVLYLAVAGGAVPPVPQPPIGIDNASSAVSAARALVQRGGESGMLVSATQDQAVSYWESVSPDSKRALMLGVLVGALVGLVGGAAAPRTFGAGVTALVGSAALLACGWKLASMYAPEYAPHAGPIAWLGAWAALGLFGAGIQIAPRKSARAPAAEPSPA